MIDLRSDTVTRPSAAMREAMMRAEVGDDVFGDDPTVNRLQTKVADLLGKEAALFVPSGTMGNQVCLKVHTRPGDEVIVERGAHLFNYESAGAAFLSSVQVHTVEGRYGVLPLEGVRRAVRPSAYYMPVTRLVCVENTHNRAGGTIYPFDALVELSAFCRTHGIALHMDGARLWNACAHTGISPEKYAACADSISVCLSKGLGCPVGSVIAGTREFIAEARRYRKVFGGGMRQAGILAAAGIFALDHNRTRLVDDHRNAREFAEGVAGAPGLEVDLQGVHTNIILLSLEKSGRSPEEVLARLKDRGVLLSAGNYMGLRAVTHLDVTTDQVREAAAAVCSVMEGRS